MKRGARARAPTLGEERPAPRLWLPSTGGRHARRPAATMRAATALPNGPSAATANPPPPRPPSLTPPKQ
jgi:hypothetical protein